MIYKIRERWIYETERGERRKFHSHEAAVEAMEFDQCLEEEEHFQEEDWLGDLT